MNENQLALLGIGVFSFMALVALVNVIRSLKQVKPKARPRMARRLLGGEDLARSMALSVVKEVVGKHPDAVAATREQGSLTPELEEALDKAQAYYINRVETRYRVLFSVVVKELVFESKDKDPGGPDVTQ